MSAILPLVLHEGDTSKVDAMGNLGKRVPYVEMALFGSLAALDGAENRDPPRVIKSHLRYEYFEKNIEEDGMKVVLVFRNPKDTLVSFYHFYRMNKVLGCFTGSWQDFLELVKCKRLHFGDLFDWYKDWWSKRNQENILVVKYEDMVKDCAAVVRKMADFFNKNIDDDIVKEIVDACSIKSMRSNPLTTLDIKGGPIDPKVGNFYRKGEIGDWKNHFTEEDSKWIDALCAEHLEPIGLTFDYE